MASCGFCTLWLFKFKLIESFDINFKSKVNYQWEFKIPFKWVVNEPRISVTIRTVLQIRYNVIINLDYHLQPLMITLNGIILKQTTYAFNVWKEEKVK